MLLALALVLGLARPPAAYLDTGSARVPLAVSSWCLGTRCGAPIAASKRAAVVGGAPVAAKASGDELAWQATRGGGLTLRATSRRGWVTYVGRLVVRG